MSTLEASFAEANVAKKLIDAMKEMVSECNFQCTPAGMAIQAMDSAHVALVHLLLQKDGFHMYNHERNTVIGVNLSNFSKILKTIDGNNMLSLEHEPDTDQLKVIADGDAGARRSEFVLKLMEIEAEQMGIPEMDYKNHISIPSSEFSKICRDMNIFGDTVTISVTRDGVKFSAASDMGEGSVFLRAGNAVPKVAKATAGVKKESAVKREPGVVPVKDELNSENDENKVKAEPADDDDAPLVARLSPAAKNKPQTQTDDASDKSVAIEMDEELTLSFALRYFNMFAKGGQLADRVKIYLARDSPCMIEYTINNMGSLRYYLAPKVDAGDQ